ncbi:spore germination protein [Metabacillus iocasae]|uniref:Spore germination protein KA n=1 Tax=Priestia iocasae TaxID=2291674 RepID=A0ABS2QVT9_9BACI|nr:spore germination protein [Metabacillus iocasae]MBM7703603.1 spore germination protein KA [Metabacillus iocasae]
MSQNQQQNQQQNQLPITIPATSSLEDNKQQMTTFLEGTDDLGEREIMYLGEKGILLYFVPLMDSEKLNQHIIKPLQMATKDKIEEVVNIASITKTQNLYEAIYMMCKGAAVLILEGRDTVYAIDAALPASRQVSQAYNEKSVRGPQEGFIENLDKNVNLIRQRFLDGSLVVKYIEIGSISKTRIALLYVKGLTNKQLVEEVMNRLRLINVDAVDTGGLIEEALEESPFSPFPQLLNTERPDRVVGNLLEGRIALITTGNASALIAPVSFFSFYQSPEDYHTRSIYGSFFRLLRVFSFFVAMSLPALYIATISFHYELIPIDLILTVKGSLENVPFPPLIEALIMVIILELLKEASLRLPSSIAQTIGVVGGLVIGTAIVEASLVSNMMIIVIALTAISSFVVPSNEMSTTLRLLSFPMMIGAALFGYLGIVLVFVMITMHLITLKSISTPYLIPIAPLRFSNLKDVFIRLHAMYSNKRPLGAKPQRLRRQIAIRTWKHDEQDN